MSESEYPQDVVFKDSRRKKWHRLGRYVPGGWLDCACRQETYLDNTMQADLCDVDEADLCRKCFPRPRVDWERAHAAEAKCRAYAKALVAELEQSSRRCTVNKEQYVNTAFRQHGLDPAEVRADAEREES